MVRALSSKHKGLSEWIPVSLIHNGQHMVLIEYCHNDQRAHQRTRNDDDEQTEEDCTGETILYQGIDNSPYGLW